MNPPDEFTKRQNEWADDADRVPVMIARTICNFSRGVVNARRAFNYSQQQHPRKLACWNPVAARAFNREESASASCLAAGLSLALVASGYGTATNCGWFSSDVPEQQSTKLEDLYEVGQKVMGEGCFGAVRMARRRSGSTGHGDGLVVKTIDMHRAGRDDVEREIAVMQQIEDSGGCPHIIAFVEALHTRSHAHIVMECAAGGDLFDVVHRDGMFTERRAARLARELAVALSFLHDRGFVHQDVKPENVMFNSQGCTKLVDFGCCVRSSSELATEQLFVQGTTGYMPPEWQSAAQQRQMHESSSATDMWGLGCILFVVLAGFHPFDPSGDATVEQMEQRVVSFGRAGAKDAWHIDFNHRNWDDVSHEAKALVRALLERVPKKRPTADDVLCHPWVQANCK